MIPFKYYKKIYKRYMLLYIQNKKQNIKEWFSKSREERYKYYNSDKNKTVYDNSDNIVNSALLNTFEIETNSIDKKYCKDVNRQIHYTKGRLKIIHNTLQLIFNTPFKNFYLMNNTSKSIEELSLEINNNVRKIVLYFLLSLPVIFIIIMLFSGGSVFYYEAPNCMNNTIVNNPSPSNSNWNTILLLTILAVIVAYLVITLLMSILFNTIMFIYLYYFTSKYTKVVPINN